MDKSSKERLLSAAASLFATHGFDGVSIRQIADAVGVNSALISYHFKGKQGLYAAMLEKELDVLSDFLEEADIGHLAPRALIAEYVFVLARVHRSAPFLVKLICRELIAQSHTFGEIAERRIKRLFAALYRAIERGVRAGDFRSDLKIRQAVILLAGLVNFYFFTLPISSKVVKQEEGFMDDYLRQSLDIFFRGIEITEGRDEHAKT